MYQFIHVLRFLEIDILNVNDILSYRNQHHIEYLKHKTEFINLCKTVGNLCSGQMLYPDSFENPVLLIYYFTKHVGL